MERCVEVVLCLFFRLAADTYHLVSCDDLSTPMLIAVVI